MHFRSAPLVVLLAFASMGAQYRTTNFVVTAPNAQIAQQMGQWAEHYRREKAMQWLGQEMPQWGRPCPLVVQVTMDPPSGATSFQFGQGQILDMKMEIQGPLDRLMASVLPHEITHTVFAYHFRCPVPRWADEGGSVLSEDDVERDRHDKLTRSILNKGQQIPLRRLLALKEYPREVMCLYAQGYSMCDFLVKRSDRKTFLGFVAHGMQYGWDQAVNSFYGHRNVEDLEEAWMKWLRDTRRGPSANPNPIQVASTQESPVRPNGDATGKPIVRMTVPPVQPLDPSPVFRGVPPTPEQMGQRFNSPEGPGPNPHHGHGNPNAMAMQQPVIGQPTSGEQPQWQRPNFVTPASNVTLGTPEYLPPPRAPGYPQ
ncbi:MAG: hypothetical protein K2X38_24340 [Gemmataceae bacterium]|nr:hypothetical protein [Gemmataceae bacterium]